MAFRVERGLTATPEIRALIGELDAELGANYLPEQRHGISFDMLFAPHVRFFVAWTREGAQGCGGVALISDFAELKRMYVRRESRGSGVAEAILERLTNEAVSAGMRLLRLETGIRQERAIRFYERCGFRVCGAFEPYASMAPSAIITSVFMEKAIYPAADRR
jgi:putative acetyltransferase